MSSWYLQCDDDVIVSSRVRLARNIDGIAFPSRLSDDGFKSLCGLVKDAMPDNLGANVGKLNFIDMNLVPDTEKAAMVERHVISPAFCENSKNRGLILSNDESVSVMVGEEDHIRIQVIMSGSNIDECYKIADNIDDALSDKLKIAFDKRLGFLTECPTNLGIGMRASFMLHLPALQMSGQINKIADSVNKIGLTVRGIYGEGSQSKAALYQLSNQITLGISEQNAIDNLKSIAMQIVEKEKEARESISRIRLEDAVLRAKGTLMCCKILSSEEMMSLLSQIKLGISMGIIDLPKELPVRLMIEGQPNMLQKKYGNMTYDERDITRADFISKNINNEV
ncbi:MAG: protein arginine kinase [Clostridia bacterium]|nr:protein arginine kinase [Clostridia bacterium]